MGARLALSRLTVAGFSLVSSQLAAAPPPADPAPAPGDRVASIPSSLEQLAAEGAMDFRAGRYEESLTKYRKAEALTEDREERAALAMNQAACLVELGRLGEAKRVFLAVAETNPELAPKARLNAAILAVEEGNLDEAERLLEQATPLDPSLVGRATAARARISERRIEHRRERFLGHIRAATRAINQGDPKNAELALLTARTNFEVATSKEKVDVLHGLASARLNLSRPEDAKVAIDEALALAPQDPTLHFALGHIEEDLERTDQARASYRRALSLGLAEPEATLAGRRLAALDPLDESGWLLWLNLAGGYDTNPRQSGIETETALGRRGRGGSIYGRAALEFGRSQRVDERASLRLVYQGDFYGFQKRTVQDLSLQEHGARLGVDWAPTTPLLISLDAGPSFAYIGLRPIEAFGWDLVLSARTRYRASRHSTYRLSLEARGTTGAEGWEYLSGNRFDAELSHTWYYQPLDLKLGLRGRLLTMGTRTTLVDSSVITACQGQCDGAEYQIPSSYDGFGPLASVGWQMVPSLRWVGSTSLDWRSYRDESYIVGVDESRKRRSDFRVNASLALEWALDRDEHFLVVPSYSYLSSSSNIAQSNDDPAHAYDYDDRSYSEHFVELGLEVSY